MRVVAVLTTHAREQLEQDDVVVADLAALDQALQALGLSVP